MSALPTTFLILSILIGLVVQQPKSDKAGTASSNTNDKPKASKLSPEEEKKAAEIESFITYVQSVPAEFSADLLIQLVESGQIKDPKRKQELLVEAFYTAGKAKEPVKRLALPGSAVDSRAGYRATASNAGLDALSLQCRAIKALLALNKEKARQLFSEVKVKLEPLACEDALAYDVDSFFSTIKAIAQTAFSAEEITQGEHVNFVEGYISKINSPIQIQPAAKTILSLTATDLELANLGRAFAAALQRIPADDRSFSAPWNSEANSLMELVAHFRRRELSGDDIIDSYRTYLIKQLGGSRCADTDSKERMQRESDVVKNFNERLRLAAYKKIAPISEDETKPAKREGFVRDEAYWTSQKSRGLLSRIKKLRFSSAGKEFADQEKQSAEWQSQLSHLVRELASWIAEDEKSEEDYFHQKCVIYYALIKTIPLDQQYEGVLDEALRDFATMLSSSPLQKEKPAEWFLHAKVLIDRVNKSKPPEHDKLVNLVYSLRSTVLHLYVQKQQLFKVAQ